jgi:hypothetical protein
VINIFSIFLARSLLNVVLATSWKWLILCTYHKRGRRPQDLATSHRKTCRKLMASSRAMI